MRAQEIMTEEPACVSPDDSVREAARLMHERNVGLIPVIEGNRRLTGVVTDRDIAIRCVGEGRSPDTKVREVMSREVQTARASDDLRDVMALMGREQVRRIPVVDDRGSLVGIVSQADLVLRATDDEAAEHTIERISREGGSHSQ